MNRNAIAAISGIIFESYNNTLYGFFAVILAPVFFPPNEYLSSISASFLAFAAGYLARPIGGIVLGFIGDRFGRKRALLLSSLLTTVPTFIIGILPSYASIGVLAPILLISCRLVQGVAIGADYTGSIIYIAEQNGIKNKNFVTSILVAMGFFGAALGLFVSLLFSFVSISDWSWRLSFIFGSVVGIVICFMRLKMEESSAFQYTKDQNLLEKNPILSTFRSDKKQLVASCILGGANLVPIYLATVYMNVHLKDLVSLSTYAILIDNLSIFLIGGILVICSSKLISRFGEINIMNACMFWFISLSIPLYTWSFSHISIATLLLLQGFLIIGDAFQISALAIFLPKLFPSSRRYSGLGFSYAMGQAILGGTTPLIASLLVEKTGQTAAPSYFLCVVAIFYVVAIAIVKRSLIQPTPLTQKELA
ncbi:MAG: MFS transporter [Alphaproteobacteria bacterium]|nr:MFS transporter [Alphaproteobacteria bacterium]